MITVRDRKILQAVEIIGRLRKRSNRDLLLEVLCENSAVYSTLKKLSLLIVANKLKLPKRLTKSNIKLINLYAYNKNTRKGKSIVKQSGGFLPAIVPIILQIISSVL